MAADWTIKEGDVEPVFYDQLELSNGEKVNLTGATVQFVMRSPTAAEPLKLAGTVTVIQPEEGEIGYLPAAADTQGRAGMFMASWVVVFPGGKQMTFPTEGYLWVSVEEALTVVGGPQLLIGLPEVKEYLRLPANDHAHDGELIGLIEDVRPLIEEHTGPIIPQTFDEWYNGGNSTIALRHKPSYGLGTSPIFELLAVSEYRGPIEYNLSIVSTPTQGSVYSVMLQPELGVMVRRTAGGGTYAFWHDPSHAAQTVHVIYRCGQQDIPRNVARAARETIRWWWMTTMAIGRGRETQADAEQQLPHVALPYHVVAMLSPTRRHPSLA